MTTGSGMVTFTNLTGTILSIDIITAFLTVVLNIEAEFEINIDQADKSSAGLGREAGQVCIE